MSTLLRAMSTIKDRTMLPVPPSSSKTKNYKFHETLGSGSFGTVIRATWTPPAEKSKRFSWSRSNQSRIVAVKIISKYLGSEVLFKNEVRQAMQFELSLMPELDHPNIVKCYEVFESPGLIFLSLEYLQGGALFDRIYNDYQKFRESDATRIVKSILEGVKYLHDHDIVHHDLKPENVMLRSEDPDSDIVIVDFGLAQRVPTDGIIKSTYTTEEYAAPEMLWGKAHGKPIDLWALGVIAHELLDGHLPFQENGTFSEAKAAHCRLELPYPYWNDISDEAISFLKCLLCEVEYRLTADQALEHRWFKRPAPKEEPILRGFHDNFCARKSWKKGMNSTIAAIRLSTLAYDSFALRFEGGELLDNEQSESGIDLTTTSESNEKSGVWKEEADLSAIKV